MDTEQTMTVNPTIAVRKSGCKDCKEDVGSVIAFEYAFQPIVSLSSRSVFAYEALIRGPNEESAYSVLSQVNDSNRYRFDQACRGKAVKTAAEIGMKELLSINFFPNAVYEPAACIQSTFRACMEHGFPTERIMFEVTEGERVDDRPHLINIFENYNRFGFKTAIDDFGAGYAGLSLLSGYQPHVVKIDMELVRNIHASKVKQAIVHGVVLTCKMIGSLVVAEGIETKSERDCLAEIGIDLMQGYLFARPAFRSLAIIDTDTFV